MSNSPAPTNYEWTGNTLTFILATGVTGVKLKYQKAGESNWTEILNSPKSAPTTCTLDASIYGPNGTVCGASLTEGSSGGGGWGTEVCNPIVNS